MISCSRISKVLLIVLVTAITGCGDSEPGKIPQVQVDVNLLENPSFEEWDGSVPAGWRLEHLAGEGENECFYGRSGKEKFSGEHSFYIRGVYDTDRWYVLVQRFPVMPGYKLKVGARLRAKRLKRNKDQKPRASIFVRFLDKNGKKLDDDRFFDFITRRRAGTIKWHITDEERKVPKDARYAELGLINSMTGYLYFDDAVAKIVKPLPWIEEETEYVDFHYFREHPFPSGSLEKVATRVEGYVERMGIDLDEKIEYYYYGTEEKFKEVTGLDEYEQKPVWGRKELHTIDPEENDEIIHLIIAHLGYPPLGLARGLNYALRGTLEGEDIHATAKNLLIKKQIPALYKTLEKKRLLREGTSRIIPAWASFCKYLIDEYGMEKFMKLYKTTDEVESPGVFNVRFKGVYGEEFPVVDRSWRLYILRYQPPEKKEEQSL